MKRIYLFFLLISNSLISQNLENAAYKNLSLSDEERIDNLLDLMTLEEKIGQLSTPLGWPMYHKKNDFDVEVSKEFKDEVKLEKIGALWGTLRADPWTKKTLKNGLDPVLAAKATNAIQRYVIENTRLGIPLLLAEEAMHGHMAIGTTVFPSAIGQGSTWNPGLIEEMASIIAKEVRSQGAHIGYGPILDLAREPRWSRVEETFGEDPYLNAKLGVGVIKGFQGKDLKSGENVISTLKHFAAYGVSEGGHNGAAVRVGNRDLYSNYLYPFEEAIKTGAQSVMTAYSSIDGIPSTAHKELLTDVLKEKWGFDGFVVSDLGSIEGLIGDHKVAADNIEAAAMALKAGVDSDLGGKAYSSSLKEALSRDLIAEDDLNTAVRRILKLKFKMGLFENPYVDVEEVHNKVRTEEHIKLARQLARESIVLLKNEAVLPLSKKLKKIAVIGPNANNVYNQLGDYTAPQPEDNIVTVLEGIKNKLPEAEVLYEKGTAIRDTINTDIEAAVDIAKQAEVAIVVLGGSSARDFKTEYKETGAAKVSEKDSLLSDMESGEGFDRATLNLMGKQLDLLKAVKKTGTPTILVTIKGRPLLLNWPSKNIPAIVEAWYPGQEGGNAIADILFGDYNPAGRLPVSVPKSVGQLPVFYNQWPPKRHNYVEMDAEPLYPFGYGLSYSNFEYSDLEIQVNEDGSNTKVAIVFKVKNNSDVDGDEVVQLYLNDMVSSVVTPIKSLRGFQRAFMKAGEVKTFQFELEPNDLALFNTSMKKIVEKGEFLVMVGASSEDIKLKENFKLTEPIKLEE